MNFIILHAYMHAWFSRLCYYKRIYACVVLEGFNPSGRKKNCQTVLREVHCYKNISMIFHCCHIRIKKLFLVQSDLSITKQPANILGKLNCMGGPQQAT